MAKKLASGFVNRIALTLDAGMPHAPKPKAVEWHWLMDAVRAAISHYIGHSAASSLDWDESSQEFYFVVEDMLDVADMAVRCERTISFRFEGDVAATLQKVIADVQAFKDTLLDMKRAWLGTARAGEVTYMKRVEEDK